MPYRHSQLGWHILAMLAVIDAAVVVAYVVSHGVGFPLVALIASFVFTSVILILFFQLVVEVDNESIKLSFGVGIISKVIQRETIASVEAVRNKWYWGLGIRYYGAGWMWNIAGLSAVQLNYKDGKQFRIGTDEPDKLAGLLD